MQRLSIYKCKPMRKIVFLTFANSKLSPTLRRIKKEAKQSGFFDYIHVYDESNLDAEFWRFNKDWVVKNPRGYGYWIWKPYLIRRELQTMSENDVLVYLDAGCTINAVFGSERFNQYLEMLQNKSIVCFSHKNCLEIQYDKMDFLVFMGLDSNEEFLQSRQVFGGIFLMKKQKDLISFVDQWYKLAQNHHLIDDSTSNMKENPAFKEHRHDQSIFSALLWGRTDVVKLNQEEVYSTPCDITTMKPYPFWASRRKEYKPDSLIDKIKRKIVFLLVVFGAK